MNILDELRMNEMFAIALSNWGDYRTKVTSCILDNTENFENIAIFGAGGCNDIDLKIIEEKYDQVFLLDINDQSMKEGLKQYGLENSKKIKLERIDFLGIEDRDYLAFGKAIERCLQESSLKGLDSDVVEQLEVMTKIIKSYQLNLGENKYKNGVIIGVHSQLNVYFEFILQKYGREYSKYYGDSVLAQLIRINEIAVKKLNDAILKSVNNKLFMGYEKKIVGKNGTIQGACQGEYDLKGRSGIREINMIPLAELIWPFSQERTYNVNIVEVNKL